ncbi:MAG: hypothetical protein AAF346_15365 [Pseudomonadota bacterium]
MPKTQALTKLGEPKIRGYLARRANTAVFLYRRRRNETWLITCDYGDGKGKSKRPRFEVGSRFAGRFYPGRCSLSPNGDHFVYFVMGGHQSTFADQHYCWTAMCKPPQITAEFLLPHDDTWGGGGVFLDDKSLVIFSGMYHGRKELQPINNQVISGTKVYVSDTFGEIPDAAQGIKAVDDGWRGTAGWEMLSGRWWKKCGKLSLLARYRDDWQQRGGFDCYQYFLVDQKNKPLSQQAILEDVQWADFDRLNRLWVTRGQQIEIFNPAKSDTAEKSIVTIDLELVVERSRT